ncbi:hypothetical protein F5Y03DRAFT_402609 [Xylaria venustula]|nr:hypothetical protein F5Y03DRAFT_402609 [Xylaria venustula]
MAEPNLRRDQPYLMQLPVETILAIGEFLSIADLGCLALTCKNMFTILDDMEKITDILQYNIMEKEIFLSRLEQSAPGLVYCPFLKVLVPYNYKGKVDTAHFNENEIFRSVLNFRMRPIIHVSEVMNTWTAVTYEQVRLMRNYQLFGPRHGLALSSLDHEFRTRRRQMTFMRRQCHMRSEGSWKFRWIDGELFLSRTRTVFLTGLKKKKRNVSFKALEHFISQNNAVICNHCMIATNFYQRMMRIAFLKNRVFEISSALSHNSGHHSRHLCRYCDTDCRIDIHQPVPGGLQFTFTTWHNLGSCSFPFDSKWERMISSFSDLRTISRRKFLYRVVERKWSQAMTEEEREEKERKGAEAEAEAERERETIKESTFNTVRHW